MLGIHQLKLQASSLYTTLRFCASRGYKHLTSESRIMEVFLITYPSVYCCYVHIYIYIYHSKRAKNGFFKFYFYYLLMCGCLVFGIFVLLSSTVCTLCVAGHNNFQLGDIYYFFHKCFHCSFYQVYYCRCTTCSSAYSLSLCVLAAFRR